MYVYLVYLIEVYLLKHENRVPFKDKPQFKRLIQNYGQQALYC